jgi:PAS domain S-box-containing protein
MSTEPTTHPDCDMLNGHDVVACLRSAGAHPLMYAFPQGAVFTFDRDLRYLSAGGHDLADVGLSRTMLEGKTIFEVFPRETTAVIEPSYRAALAGTTTTSDVAYDGRIYSQRLAPVSDATGTVVAGLGFTEDVTDRRVTEHALRVSEERNRLTIEHAPIGKAIVELDGKWRHVNAALTELTGYSEDQLLMLTFQDITHPDDLDLDLHHLNELVAGDIGSYQMEKRYLTAPGLIVWVLLSVSLVRDEQGSPLYFIAQIQDITEAKRRGRALQDLTAMLAHDARAPAAVILGFAELLQGPASTEAAHVRDYASRISAAAHAMTDLLENSLTATALDSGQLIASPRSVSLRRAIATVIRTVDLRTMRADTAGVDEVASWVDPVHLGQVITNLLTNAAKYGGDTVTISAVADKGRVRISIADDGPGVEPSFVPHLFERFSRSAAARSGRQRGSGLGLYIVRDVLAANDGTIRYATSSSGGAEFTLDLGAAPAASRTGIE